MRGRRQLYVDEPDAIEAEAAVVADARDFEQDTGPDKTPDAASDADEA